jgi:ParB family chromosome partitioning protein
VAKLDQLLKTGGSNIAESMGAGPERGEKSVATSTIPSRWQGVTKSKDAVEIPLDKIIPDLEQPREDFEPESLSRLAESLKARGQLQPIRVRWDESQDRYILICGERRWRAANLAGLTRMSCIVSEGPIDPGELLAMQLVENCLREDLKPIEQARAFKAIMERNGWSGNQAAKELGIAQPTVVRALALLELPPPVQAQVEQGTLAPATAYEIGKARDPELQRQLAARVVDEGLSRCEAIEVVRTVRKPAAAKPHKGRGAAGSKKLPTSLTLKAAGCKITVEHRKGVDNDLLLTALREALEQLEAKRQQAA